MNIKICGRSKGQSAIAASAFRSGEKLKDYETGQTFNYPEKEGIVFSEVCLCDNAPAEYSDRETFWNAVHKVDNKKNEQYLKCSRNAHMFFKKRLTEHQKHNQKTTNN